MSPKKDASRSKKNAARGGQIKSPPISPENTRQKTSQQKELTHADVVAGNEQRREEIKHVDQTGERHPDQQGETANIRQNTSNVNRKHMR